MGLTEAEAEVVRAITATNSFELLVQGVVDYGIYMLDPDGRIASWNPGAERIKGYAAEEVIGRHFSIFYTPEDRANGLPERALKVAAEDSRYSSEGWRIRKDGTSFWAAAVIDRINSPDGNLVGFAKITRDMTEQRSAQINLEKSQHQLFQLQKMEAVGQLSGGLAHDFNNLLTGISGSLELLRLRMSQGRLEEAMRYIQTAESAASRAAALTHRLLAFSRRQTLDPRPTCVRTLVSDMHTLIEGSIGPAVQVQAEFTTDLSNTLCDPNQLENAILNLCINARDAMGGEGTIVIDASNAALDERVASDEGLAPGQYVKICVNDTGIGMTPDVLAHAFEPFFTTKPSGHGTGLGLSMVYGFAKQSGGSVRIHTEPGRGTTVCLYLPRSAEEVATNADRPQGPSGMPRADDHHTILVVDDEDGVRMFVVEILEELGYRTLEADDGLSGLKVLESDHKIDLLVSDVGLPGGMNGRQMTDAARGRRPDLPVLYITGYAQSTVFGDAVMERGVGILTKPFGIDDLATHVKRLIDAG